MARTAAIQPEQYAQFALEVSQAVPLDVLAEQYGCSRPSIRRAAARPEVAQLIRREGRRLRKNAARQHSRDQERIRQHTASAPPKGFPSRAAAKAARPELDYAAQHGIDSTAPGPQSGGGDSHRTRSGRGGARIIPMGNVFGDGPPPDWQCPRAVDGKALGEQGMRRVPDPRGGWQWVPV